MVTASSLQLDLDSTISHKSLSRADDERLLYPEPYVMPNEEDIYLPIGRKWVDREELRPAEDIIELGPPALENDFLFRQQFAIHDYVKTLRHQIANHDINSKLSPHQAIKPAIK